MSASTNPEQGSDQSRRRGGADRDDGGEHRSGGHGHGGGKGPGGHRNGDGDGNGGHGNGNGGHGNGNGGHGNGGHGGHGHGNGGHGGHGNGHESCLSIPRLERLNYFFGQMLGVREFQSEQTYFREKQKLHNRFLHGNGVVCGLAVTPCPTEQGECDPPPPEPCVMVQCGLGLDCLGNEIVVRNPSTVRLADHMSIEDRRRLRCEGGTVWLSICFREQLIQPSRPLAVDECGAALADCIHAMVRDDFCIRVAFERPDVHPVCSACSDPCCDACLVLAKIEVPHGHPITEDKIDNTVRHPFAAFDTTRIDRIGWTHGAQYTREEASALLRKGLYFHFTRPVHASTVTAPGVFDLWAIEGGRGRRGLIYHIDTRPESEDKEMVRWVRFQNLTDEVLQPGDRVLVMMRAGFVLDECCRSLDGDHTGGLLCIAHDYKAWDRSSEVPQQPCVQPPPRQLLPWTTGNGEPAGNFESWFYIEADSPPPGPYPGGGGRRGQP
jgi:hypothetical protein